MSESIQNTTKVPAQLALLAAMGKNVLYPFRALENSIQSGGNLAAGANAVIYTPPAGQAVQMLEFVLCTDVATKIDVRAGGAVKFSIQLRANETKIVPIPQPGMDWGLNATININNAGAAAIVWNATFMWCLESK